MGRDHIEFLGVSNDYQRNKAAISWPTPSTFRETSNLNTQAWRNSKHQTSGAVKLEG
jgi:hypothetical protein